MAEVLNRFPIILFISISALIIVHIITIILIRKYISQFEKNQFNVINSKLNEISSVFTLNIVKVTEEINKFTIAINNQISEIKNKHEFFVDDLGKNFKTFTNNLILDYEKYVNKVNDYNFRLERLLVIINDNISVLNALASTLSSDNKTLEEISDKTKELLSTNEKLVKDFNDLMNELFENLSNTTKDHVKQLVTHTDAQLTALKDDTENDLKSSLSSFDLKINELFTSGPFNLFNKNVKLLETEFSDHIKQIETSQLAVEMSIMTINNELNEIKKKGIKLFRL